MKIIINLIVKFPQLIRILKGECLILTVVDDTLVVDAGNHDEVEVKNLASTFFKFAYKLST